MKFLLLISFFILNVLIISCGEKTPEKIPEDKNPCVDVDCSNHGRCSIDDSTGVDLPACTCDSGYYLDRLNCNETPPAICLNNGSQKIVFEDVTNQLKLQEKNMIGTNITVTDFDQDHWPDVVVSKGDKKRYNMAEPDYLYGLFKNKKGVFEDYTWESKLFKTRDGEDGRISSYVIFGDVNNDGLPDALNVAYIDNSADTDLDKTDIFINNGDTTFSIYNKQSFSPDTQYNPASSAFFIDYDKDGYLDLFISHHYTSYGLLSSTLTDTLYKGRKNGSFIDVTEDMGLKTLPFTVSEAINANANTPSWGASACDLNNDGNEEILVSSYGRQTNLLFMYENDKFINKSIVSGFAYDDIEYYMDNQFFACYCEAHPSVTECENAETPLITCTGLENNWNLGFDDKAFRLGGNTSNTLCADFDNDGDNDLLSIELAHWHIGKSSDKTQLLMNDGFPNTPLRRVSEEESGITRNRIGSWNDGDLGGVAEDLNNDGKIDIVITSSDYPGTTSLIYEQLDNTESSSAQVAKFMNVTDDSGLKLPRAHGIALIDYDRDGDYDIMMGQSLMRWTADDEPSKPTNSFIHLFENKTGQSNNKIMIDIKGAGYTGKSNMDAIGAKIIVEANGKIYTRTIQGAYGLFGIQKDPFIIIGIGDNCKADKITIKWPNNTVSSTAQVVKSETVLTDVPANYVLMINEEFKVRYLSLDEYRGE